MWLSKQGKGFEPNRTVETGAVTLTGGASIVFEGTFEY